MIIHKHFTKQHKPLSNSAEYKSTTLSQGRFGLKAIGKGYIELKQINAIKHFFKRFLKKKKGRVFYRLFPEFFVTKKSLGNARMGKGKSSVDRLMFIVKKGQILFEVKYKHFVSDVSIYRLLVQCKYRLSINVKIFKLHY